MIKYNAPKNVLANQRVRRVNFLGYFAVVLTGLDDAVPSNSVQKKEGISSEFCHTIQECLKDEL